MHTGLLHFHSFLRYVVLILIVISIIKSLAGWGGKKAYLSVDHKLSLFSMISVHLQFLIGLILYFISPIVKIGLSDFGAAMGDSTLRFWTLEHLVAMIIAIAIITIGKRTSKKIQVGWKKHKRIAITFSIGLVIMLLSIPWPVLSRVTRPWF